MEGHRLRESVWGGRCPEATCGSHLPQGCQPEGAAWPVLSASFGDWHRVAGGTVRNAEGWVHLAFDQEIPAWRAAPGALAGEREHGRWLHTLFWIQTELSHLPF